MVLSGGAIAGISVVCVIAFALLVWLLYYVIKKKQRDDAYFDRCSRIWKRYGSKGQSGFMARFPYTGATFVRTPVPGQQMTQREMQMSSAVNAPREFVVPATKVQPDVEEPESMQLMSMNKPIDPDTFDPKLYSSDFSEQEETESPRGGPRPPQVLFSVEFDVQFNVLKVHVNRAKHLKSNEQADFCNPYFTVSVIPGGHEKQSRIIRKTVDPLFQESFMFDVPQSELSDKTVQLKFYNSEQQSRDECIGIVVQRLDELNLSTKVDLWRKVIRPDTEKEEDGDHQYGEMLLRIGYLPSAEKLTVVLLKARNLLQVGTENERKAPDPYIRVSIFHEGGLLKKKKTSTKRQTLNPTYNQAINFAVPLDVLPQVEIQFSVVHESGDKVSREERKEEIGYLEIGPHSRGTDLEHWRDLMSNKPQARWHHLKAPSDVGRLVDDDDASADVGTPSTSMTSH